VRVVTWYVVLLSVVFGVSLSGCWRSAALPPEMSIPSTPARSVPSAVRARSWRGRPLVRPESVPTLSSDVWKPNVPAREWTSIVIHHTATDHGSVESIHEAHLHRKDKHGNPWQGIGYHFVIGNGSGMDSGEIQPTFRWREQMHGAHAGSREFNQHGIGIALVGNFDLAPPPPAQLSAVKRLIAALKAEYGISSDQVIGHGDIKATACPGKHFPISEVAQSFQDTWIGNRGHFHPTVQLADMQRNRKR